MMTVPVCVAFGAMTIGFAMAETASEALPLVVLCWSFCAALTGLAAHCQFTRAAPRATLSAQVVSRQTDTGMRFWRANAMRWIQVS